MKKKRSTKTKTTMANVIKNFQSQRKAFIGLGKLYRLKAKNNPNLRVLAMLCDTLAKQCRNSELSLKLILKQRAKP